MMTTKSSYQKRLIITFCCVETCLPVTAIYAIQELVEFTYMCCMLGKFYSFGFNILILCNKEQGVA